MSVFTGRQQSGALRMHRARLRADAAARNAATPPERRSTQQAITDPIQVAGCLVKRRWYDRQDAKAERARMGRGGCVIDELVVYECPFSAEGMPHWHLGHPAGTPRDNRKQRTA